MYEIIIAKDAIEYLDTLQEKDRERILNALDRSRVRPEHFFKRLVGEELYKLRVGDYRVIAQIKNQQLHILVVKIGHRKNIYDKL